MKTKLIIVDKNFKPVSVGPSQGNLIGMYNTYSVYYIDVKEKLPATVKFEDRRYYIQMPLCAFPNLHLVNLPSYHDQSVFENYSISRKELEEVIEKVKQ